MNTKQLIKHFGSQRDAMAAVDCRSHQLWYVWAKNGIPQGRQAMIALQTGGALSVTKPRTVDKQKKAA
jgi:hypothetical protein